MTTELITCPRCGASPNVPPDAQGQYICAYCGSHFRTHAPVAARPVHVAPPAPLAARTARKKTSAAALALAVVGALVLLVAAGGVLAVLENRERHRGGANGSGEPAASPTAPSAGLQGAAPTVASELPATATFDPQSRASGYQSSFYVLGFVKNTSPFAIDKPKVTAVLLDASGKELATRDGYAEGEVLLPQASTPVKVLISDPPKHDHLGFEVVATKASYFPEDSPSLRLEILEAPHSTGGSSWEVTGKVFNEGKQASRFVNVLVMAFDAKEQLIGLDSTYVDGEAIAPAASARFRALPLYDAPPHHFKYTVSGRPLK